MSRSRARHIDTKRQGKFAGRSVWIDELESRVLLSIVAPAAADTWTIGNKSLLYIRVAYADTPTSAPGSLAQAQSTMATVNDYYLDNSFGLTSFSPTFTDLVVLPQTKAFYVSAGAGRLRTDALSAAAAADPLWNYQNYTLDVVSYQDFGEALHHGNIGTRGVWLLGSDPSALAHELGHNFGVGHANRFVPSDGASLFGPGTSVEYGDNQDNMGSGRIPGDHFGAWAKYHFGWLTDSNIVTPTSSGVYRIYADDLGGQRLADGTYGLKFNGQNPGDSYWVEYRDRRTNAPFAHNGVSLHFVPNGSLATQQLIPTPTLTLGMSYTDPLDNFVITPLRTVAATATAPQAIDVQVSVGDLKNNHAPIIASASASATKVNSGAPVTFNASATDPDGDPLMYTWDFGLFGGLPMNGQQVTESFGEGYHAVRLTVSDMKGGVASQDFLITSGSPDPNVHVVSGRVVDAAGKPIPNILVWLEASNFINGRLTAFTDGDGSFDITDVPSGTFPLRAGDYGYTLSSANVSIGSTNVSGAQLSGSPRFRALGRVVDANGTPVAGATVSNGSQTTTTSSTGDFALSTGTGTSILSASKSGYLNGSREVIMFYADNLGNDITLQAAGGTNDTTPPTMPGNLRSTAQTASSISLAWTPSTDNVGVSGYEVFRNGARVATLNGSVSSFTDQNLSAATSYDYRLEALDAAGNRSVPATLSATTSGVSGAAGLAATYFDNMDFTGATVSRTDNQINFDWGLGAPISGIAADTFSVRWTGFITAPASGTYTLYTTSDDGARLWVNNQLLVDKLVPQGTTEWSGTINLTAGQRVPIRMDYFDRYNGAVAKLSWSGPGIAKQIIPASAFGGGGTTADTTPPTLPGNLRSTAQTSSSISLAWTASTDNVGVSGYELFRNGTRIATLGGSATNYTDSGLAAGTSYNYGLVALDASANRSGTASVAAATAQGSGGTAGLSGTYFDNMDFTGTSVTRNDQQVNFNWGLNAPIGGIGADTFSVRWTGFVTAPASGTYTFYTKTDDGVRLWVNNQLLVDKLVPQGATEWSGTINLTAGQAVPIRMDYFDRYNGAVATLSWSGPGIAKQIIPGTALSTDGQVTPPPPPPPEQKPYLGTPFGDGQVIEAEDFDIGGEGIAYHDTEAGNQSGTFRSDEGVDVGDITGGRVVGRANEGEWLEYTVRSTYSTTMPFKLDTKYVTPKSGVVLRFLIDGVQAGTATLAPTGSYGGTYQTASTTVNIAPGTHVLRVEFAAGGTDVGNFDSFKLTSQQTTQTGTINGVIWNDANANKVRDAGEVGLANWRVFIDGDGDGLYDAGEISVLTDSAGKYQLLVGPGSYRVYEVVQSGWQRTTSGYHPITMLAGQTYIGKSFGNVKIA